MKRLLRKEIEDPLSIELLANTGKDFDTVLIEYTGERIKVRLEKNEEKVKVSLHQSVLQKK